jgi:hypothetical protein
MRQYTKEIISAYNYSPNVLCILVAIAVLSADLITGEDIHFPIFFAVPIGLAAWQMNRILAFAIAISCPLFREGFFFVFNGMQFSSSAVIDSFVNIVALLIFAHLTIKFVSEKRELERRLKQFELGNDS